MIIVGWVEFILGKDNDDDEQISECGDVTIQLENSYNRYYLWAIVLKLGCVTR
jgi:hypothetical protein